MNEPLPREKWNLQFRNNIRRMIARDATSRWMLAFLLLATVLILAAPTRTIQLQARTMAAEVELIAEPLSWDLTGAIICQPTNDFDAEAAAPCGFAQDLKGKLDGPITWPKNQRLEISWRPAGLKIRLLTRGAGLDEGTTLVLGLKNFKQNGAIAFSGFLSVGQEMRPGNTGYVLDGSYAIFEQGLVSRWLGWSPDVTREGRVRRGDQVQIVCSESLFSDCASSGSRQTDGKFRNPVSASISADHSGKAGFHVIATGAEANSILQVVYAGRDSVLLVKPSWVQRATTSSSLLALSILFSLIAPIFLKALEKPNRDK